MPAVFTTLFFEHNLVLVAVAAAICAVSSFAAIVLLAHARRQSGRAQMAWLGIAAAAIGTGIWATHFVAMLAFDSGIPTGYDIGLTLLSLVIAILFSGAGMCIAAAGARKTDVVLGGATVGLGISAMHYAGMASVIVGGQIAWDPQLVAASIIFGAVFGLAAFVVSANAATLPRRLGAAGLLTLAICAMHFTAMGAAGFENCYPVVGAFEPMTQILLPIGVAAASLLILGFALGGVYLEIQEARRAEGEMRRMHELANAAVEGLVICRDDEIETVNDSFCAIVGAGPGLGGIAITRFLPKAAFDELKSHAGRALETEITDSKGEKIPVEAVLRRLDDKGRVQNALSIRDLRDRKQAESHIRYLAMHDALTGLPNRAYFSEKLESQIQCAEKSGNPFAVLCLDLDRFKQVNDLFGHSAGDRVLKAVGQILFDLQRDDVFAGRLGGDEFAIILPDIRNADDAAKLAARVLAEFSEHNERSASGVILSGSIGIALFPAHAGEATHLMNAADTALYRAKQNGRETYCFYLEEMGCEVRDRRQLEHDLRLAISKHELALVYQPQVKIDSGRLTGFEALVRWHHPVRGLVSPGVFIPVAEESGLILQIGEWVLETALKEAASWEQPLSIAVNVSAVQLHDPEFPTRLHQLLRKTGLSPLRLEIEITETALVKDMARALANLAQIKALGVRIAMDDFGTGYSSLSNLRAFAFDKIKVDQSFIRSVHENEQSAAIVRAVLGLGRGLNLPVLAEGIERPEQLDFLKGEVCAEAQGFFLGKPADISTFAAYTSGEAEIVTPDFSSKTAKGKGLRLASSKS